MTCAGDYRDHEWYMDQALEEAAGAMQMREVPIGAVVVDACGQIIGRAHNLREQLSDPTAHAEILALQAAARFLGDWRLERCTIYVTLEPCPMCAGALVNARIRRLVYGTPDPKAGAVHTLMQITEDPRLNHQVEVIEGIRREESASLLRAFFRELRSGMM